MQKSRTSKLRAKILGLIIFSGAFFIAGCSFPGVYKINVQQGNIVTQEMIEQLKPGMSKRQVHFVLGEPVVKNLFDSSEENYLYSYQERGDETRTQRITVFYENGTYVRYEGELLEEHPAY